jgi:hypothetical protein
MPNLRSTIEALAAEFAVSVIGALRSASLEELLEVTNNRRRVAELPPATRARRTKGGRLGRRSAGEITGMVDAIVALVQKHPGGLRAEQIREALACEAKELPRPLAEAVSAGRLTKTGQKRATTYSAGNGGSGGRRRGKKRPRAT